MNLEMQIEIMNQLILENPDITIAEFIEIVAELDQISGSEKKAFNEMYCYQ